MWKSLVFKSWLETRARFLWGLALVTGAISHTVLTASKVIPMINQQMPWQHLSFSRYLWVDVYAGSLLATWTGFTVLFSTGGLRTEELSGATAFTLSLPVRRNTLLQAQAVVGLTEAIALGFLPAFLVPGLSALTGNSFPASQAMLHAVLLVGAGVALFGWSFLMSQIAQGEFMGLAISLGSIGAFFVLVKKVRALDDLDIFDTMTGADMLDRQTFLLHGPLPWLGLVATVATMAGMLWLAMWLIERHDF